MGLITLFGAILFAAAAAEAQDRRKPVDEFQGRMREAKTAHEKALAIRALGEAAGGEAEAVPALARHLAPVPSDSCSLLPLAAADALGRFRGNAAAARALAAAAGEYRKHPYVLDRITRALGRVGHESGLALFDEALKGPDPEAAVAAMRTVAEFPPSLAVKALVREMERLERAEPADPRRAEVLKLLQKITGEKYPSLPEFALWWKKRGAAFVEGAAKREGVVGPAPVPPLLLVELRFRENQGQTTRNSGATAGHAPAAVFSKPAPVWTGTAAPGGGPAALEWEPAGGTQAVDLAGIDGLKTLKSFTLAMWIQRTHPGNPKAGQRLVSWLAPGKTGEGIELILNADGSLALGVDQAAELSPARSRPGLVPVLDPKDKEPWKTWRFVAVTFDGGRVHFYAGTPETDAGVASSVEAALGASGSKVSPHLTVGNVPPAARGAQPGRAFRGRVDEVRVFGSGVDGSGALGADDVVRVQNRLGQNP